MAWKARRSDEKDCIIDIMLAGSGSKRVLSASMLAPQGNMVRPLNRCLLKGQPERLDQPFIEPLERLDQLSESALPRLARELLLKQRCPSFACRTRAEPSKRGGLRLAARLELLEKLIESIERLDQPPESAFG